jgi:DNA mismatch endonuclease Vsr
LTIQPPAPAKRTGWPDVPEGRRRTMRANRSKHTKPERFVRSLLHRLGYRFRLHRRDLPGWPDIVLPSRRAVIQVHGCFWHQHEGCRAAQIPKTRTEYWMPKLKRNVERDRAAECELAKRGWKIMVMWECELTDPPMTLVDRVMQFLGPPGRRPCVSEAPPS